MPSLLLPRKWTSQPQVPVGIDRGNPLTRGLVNFICPSMRDFILVGSEPKISTYGYITAGDGGTHHYKNVSIATNAVTIFTLSTRDAAAADYVSTSNASGNNTLTIGRTSSFFRAVNGGTSMTRTFATATTHTDYRAYASVYDNGVLNVYALGVIDNGSLTGSVTGAVSYNNFVSGGIRRSSTTFAPSGQNVALALIWDRALSAPEIKAISDNSWQVFAPVVT